MYICTVVLTHLQADDINSILESTEKLVFIYTKIEQF